MKVNADFSAPATVKFDESKYIPSPSYGVDRFMLDRIGDEKARATTIVRYRPNSKFPEHTHVGGEEFLVLEGTFHDQFGKFKAGTYVRNPIGSVHEPWVEDDGCTIFVKLLQMADTGEGTAPLHVDTVKQKPKPQENATQSTLPLYSNAVTGEHVEMLWVNANSFVPTNDVKNGEEILIVEGDLHYAGKEYNKRDWLRFPASDKVAPEREALKSGKQGAQLYRKRGNLDI